MGNGGNFYPRCFFFPVHPHAYGERESMASPLPAEVGSSPRIWGTVDAGLSGGNGDRFIPTHMGNGISNHLPPPWRTVHPHAYGERGTFPPHIFRSGGSSPRIWGTALVSLNITL